MNSVIRAQYALRFFNTMSEDSVSLLRVVPFRDPSVISCAEDIVALIQGVDDTLFRLPYCMMQKVGVLASGQSDHIIGPVLLAPYTRAKSPRSTK